MKVLILSCDIGGGHNSCANAIAEVYKNHGETCIIQDAVAFISKRLSAQISKWHSRIYKYFPFVSKRGYSYVENHSDILKSEKFLHRLLVSGNEKLYKYIKEENFNAVICTHPFGAIMLTDLMKKSPLPIKTAFVATDYTCYPVLKESDVDYYFIPHSELNTEFEKVGINREKIIVSGIPIRQSFYNVVTPKTARELFGIHKNTKHLLVMGGSMGCGPIERVIDNISKNLKNNCDISVICGKNNRLKNKLKKKYDGNSHIHIYGFSNEIPALMDSADLILTKPGGLCVSEALAKHLPMILMNTVAGCEEYNKDFCVNNGCAFSSADSDELFNLCYSALTDEKTLENMKKAFNNIETVNSAEVIYNQI